MKTPIHAPSFGFWGEIGMGWCNVAKIDHENATGRMHKDSQTDGRTQEERE